MNSPSDFRGEPNDSEVGARHGREAKEDTVAAGMIFDNLEDNDGWLRDERTPVARSLAARVLRSALYANNRQMSPAFKAIDFDHDRIAWFVYYVGLRFRTGLAAWPAFAWFVPWLLTGCVPGEIDLVRRFAFEGVVRAMLVVPLDDERYFSLILRSMFRDRD